MSFVLDVIALLLLGYLTGRVFTVAVVLGGRLMERAWWKGTVRATGLLIVGIFWLFGILLYLDIIRAAGMTGDDFMWNYPIAFGVSRSPTNDLLALLIAGIGYPLAYTFGHLFGWGASRAQLFIAKRRSAKYLPDLVEGSSPEVPNATPAMWTQASDRAKDYLTVIPGSFRTSVEALITASVLVFIPWLVPGRRPLLWQFNAKARVAYFRRLMSSDSPLVGNIKLVFKSVAAVAIYSGDPGWTFANYPGPPPAGGIPWHTSAPFQPSTLQGALHALR